MSDTLPLKPIDTDTVEKLRATVQERPAIAAVVNKVVEAGLKNVFFVGAGGSLICSYPAHYLLQAKAPFPAFQLQSDELNCSTPALMGPGSLVVLASYTGTTKETVAAAKTAKAAGATVIAAAKEGSPLAQAADQPPSPARATRSSSLVAYSLLEAVDADVDAARGGRGAGGAARGGAATPSQESESVLADVALTFKDEPITYVLGSGPELQLGVRLRDVLPAGDAVEARRRLQHGGVLPGRVRDGGRRHRGPAVARRGRVPSDGGARQGVPRHLLQEGQVRRRG